MNEPKEEARRMVERFFSTMLKNQDFKHVVYGDAEKHAKQCALICCDEIKRELANNPLNNESETQVHEWDRLNYYEKVKSEIELL